MSLPRAYQGLVDAFDRLPGIGPNAAERIAQHLLKSGQLAQLQQALAQAQNEVQLCQQCQSFSLTSLCTHCAEASASTNKLLVVAHLKQRQQALVQGYDGVVFVLHGLLSPLAGIGPKELGLDKLQALVQQQSCQELVLAFDNSAEGLATQQYIKALIGPEISCQAMPFEQWQAQSL